MIVSRHGNEMHKAERQSQSMCRKDIKTLTSSCAIASLSVSIVNAAIGDDMSDDDMIDFAFRLQRRMQWIFYLLGFGPRPPKRR